MSDEVNPGASPQTPAPETPAKVKYRHTKNGRRVLGTLVCVVLGVYTVAGVGAAALYLRLRQGPVDAAPVIRIAERLMSRSDHLRFRIGTMTLEWHGRDNPLGVTMDNVSLLGPRGEFLTIGHARLGLSPWHLLLARIHYDTAEVDNLSLRVIRLPDGTITLTGANQEKAQTQIPNLDTIADDLPSIDNVKFTGMQVVFEDQKEAIIRRFSNVAVEMKQTSEFGGRSISGFISATLSGVNDGSNAAVDFLYEAADKTLTAVARIDKTSTRDMIGSILRAANLPVIDMMVQGRADLRINNDFSLQSLNLQLQGDDGMLYWPRSYGEGLENQRLTKFDLRVRYAPETRTMELENAEITVKGITLGLKGALSGSAGWDTLTGDVNASIPVLAVDALPAVWPQVWDSGARHWLVDRMDKGRFAHIDVNVPLTVKRSFVQPDETDFEITAGEAEAELEAETRWNIEPGTVKAAFDFTGVTVDYRNPMLPARNTTGTGTFEGLALKLKIDGADIGNLDVTGGTLELDDLITAGKGHAYLHLDLNGSVPAVFEYLDREPIAYRKKVSLDASQARGRAKVALDIDFPTLHDMKIEDVHVKADAKLTDLSIPGVVKGLALSGPAFDLEASQLHFRISGKGALDGQPATLDWAEYFAPEPTDPFASNLVASIDTNKSIRQKFIGTLEDRIDGIIPADITMKTTPAGKGALAVTGNITNAAIDFTNPFNAVKPKGQPATLKLTGTLDKGFIQSIDTLAVSGAGMTIASGSVGFARDAKNEPVLAKATLKGLRLGANDADIEAAWPSENSLKAKVTGASFDARDIMGTAKKPDVQPQAQPTAPKTAKTPMGYDITLNLKRLYLADVPLDNATGAFIGNTGGTVKSASLDGTAMDAPLKLRYDAGGLLLNAASAGKGLAALGVTDRLRGGTLLVEAGPMQGGQPGDAKGKIVLKDFSVARAPVLAKLINLLSLPGLLNILEQDTGLKFERAEAELTILNRNGGPTISLKDGRTSGSSLGLTFEGDIDTAADTLALQGTVVPMSEVNSMLSSIPLVGDILTGGKKGSGIFAATYSIKGATSNPDVSINPLSVLTPGILRRILFEGALTKNNTTGGSKTGASSTKP